MLGSALLGGEVCRGSDACSNPNLVMSVIASGTRRTEWGSKLQRRPCSELNMKLACCKVRCAIQQRAETVLNNRNTLTHKSLGTANEAVDKGMQTREKRPCDLER
jgi:hypothetical protein